MASKSFAQTMNNAKLMLAGLKQNPERLAKRGLHSDFVAKYETAFDEAQTLDNEQEKLKAEQKSKTDALKQRLTDLGALHSEARKIVKIEMPNATWKEFGIGDKR